MVKGIDISSFQHVTDWHKVKASGIRFVYFKVNEGDLRDPGTTAAKVRAAKAAGLIVGGYDFMRPKPGRTGAQEFDIFHAFAKQAGLLTKGCLRPALDAEATKLDAAGTRAYMHSWTQRCFTTLGKHPEIYTAKWFYEGIAKEMRQTYGCTLWLAAYVRTWRSYVPAPWKRHTSVWQYTDKLAVPGISGHVDGDRYLSSMTNLKRRHCL